MFNVKTCLAIKNYTKSICRDTRSNFLSVYLHRESISFVLRSLSRIFTLHRVFSILRYIFFITYRRNPVKNLKRKFNVLTTTGREIVINSNRINATMARGYPSLLLRVLVITISVNLTCQQETDGTKSTSEPGVSTNVAGQKGRFITTVEPETLATGPDEGLDSRARAERQTIGKYNVINVSYSELKHSVSVDDVRLSSLLSRSLDVL